MRSGHVALATGGLGLRLLLTQFRIELPATATAVAFYLRLCNLSKLAYDAFCPVFRAFLSRLHTYELLSPQSLTESATVGKQPPTVAHFLPCNVIIQLFCSQLKQIVPAVNKNINKCIVIFAKNNARNSIIPPVARLRLGLISNPDILGSMAESLIRPATSHKKSIPNLAIPQRFTFQFQFLPQ